MCTLVNRRCTGAAGVGAGRSGRRERRFSRGWSRQEMVENLRAQFLRSSDPTGGAAPGPEIQRKSLAVNIPSSLHSMHSVPGMHLPIYLAPHKPHLVNSIHSLYCLVGLCVFHKPYALLADEKGKLHCAFQFLRHFPEWDCWVINGVCLHDLSYLS